MGVSSLCYENLLHLSQILTKLTSLHSTLNHMFRNVKLCGVPTKENHQLRAKSMQLLKAPI